MPLPLVHLAIAYKILAAGFPVQDPAQFYLGSISPDAIHMRNGNTRTDKNHTHLLPGDKLWNDIPRKEGIATVRKFFHGRGMYTDFAYGYSIHILTDMYWIHDVFARFKLDYKNDTAHAETLVATYYHDTDLVDYNIYNNAPWRGEVWQLLQDAACNNFLDLLSAQEIRLWARRTLQWFNEPENAYKFSGQPKYITLPIVENFIDTYAPHIGLLQ